jgi:hypothetical protein
LRRSVKPGVIRKILRLSHRVYMRSFAHMFTDCILSPYAPHFRTKYQSIQAFITSPLYQISFIFCSTTQHRPHCSPCVLAPIWVLVCDVSARHNLGVTPHKVRRMLKQSTRRSLIHR